MADDEVKKILRDLDLENLIETFTSKSLFIQFMYSCENKLFYINVKFYFYRRAN